MAPCMHQVAPLKCVRFTSEFVSFTVRCATWCFMCSKCFVWFGSLLFSNCWFLLNRNPRWWFLMYIYIYICIYIVVFLVVYLWEMIQIDNHIFPIGLNPLKSRIISDGAQSPWVFLQNGAPKNSSPDGSDDWSLDVSFVPRFLGNGRFGGTDGIFTYMNGWFFGLGTCRQIYRSSDGSYGDGNFHSWFYFQLKQIMIYGHSWCFSQSHLLSVSFVLLQPPAASKSKKTPERREFSCWKT